MTERMCVLNRCGRAQGNGTWCQVVGLDGPQPVCEEHWLALRDIFPRERTQALAAASDGRSDERN